MRFLSTLVVLVLTLAGCAGQVKPGAPGYFDSLGAAASFMAKGLSSQLPPSSLLVKQSAVDEAVNESSAEAAVSSPDYQSQMLAALNQNISRINFKSLTSANYSSLKWVVLLSFVPTESRGKQESWVRLRAAVVEVDSGKRIAFSEAYVKSAAFDVTPSRYYLDSPMYSVNDLGFRSKMAAISGSGDKNLGATLGLATKYAEGVAYYNDRQYAVASEKFVEVLSVAPNHLGALSGIYQVYWNTGLKKEAEQAFNMLAETGVDTGSISAKLLFGVGTTNFIQNKDLAEQYRIWQKGIALAVNSRKKCLDVIGHASKTGKETFNDKISQQRAAQIVANMIQAVPSAKGKFSAQGRGSAETIVGNGADDASDAIDRRVEFSVRECASPAGSSR